MGQEGDRVHLYKMIQYILLSLFLGLSAACAPPSSMDSKASPGLTGFQSESGSPYTVGGEVRLIELQEQKKAGRRPEATQVEVALARRIVGVTVKRFDQSDKLARRGRAKVEVSIELSTASPLAFKGELKDVSNERSQSKDMILNTSEGRFELYVAFEDDTEDRLSRTHMILNQVDKRGRQIAKVEIFLRSFSAGITVFPSDEVTLNAMNSRLVRLLQERGFAWVSNTVIENGRSFYEVQILAANAETLKNPDRVDLAAAGRRLFTFGGESIRTGDFDQTDSKLLSAGLVRLHSARLIGEAEVKDQRTFALLIEGQKNQNIDLALKIERPENLKLPSVAQQQKDPAVPSAAPTFSSRAYFQAIRDSKKFPRIQRTLKDFEQNRNLPEVQHWIEQYSVTEDSNGQIVGPTILRDKLVKAMANASPVRNLISSVFHHFDVAPSAALVTLIESKFFSTDNYVLETNPVSTASGPFQLIFGAAEFLGMKVFKNRPGQLPPDWDERMYVAPSACGAAKHFSRSLDQFLKYDATLMLLAYYRGDGTVLSKLEESSKKSTFSSIAKYHLKYKDIAEQRIIPTDWRNYVNRSLALHFVTSDPDRYGLKWENHESTPIPKAKIFPSGGVRDKECKDALSGFGSRGIRWL